MDKIYHETLGSVLSDMARLRRKRFVRRARELSLTHAQWRVLSMLRYHTGINQSALAEILEVEPITLAWHIDRLEEKGWVERHADPTGRCAWLLYFDDSVESIINELENISEWNRKTALTGFSADEIQRFTNDLTRVNANLLAAERMGDKGEFSAKARNKITGYSYG